jgi:N-acetylneuraminate synthase
MKTRHHYVKKLWGSEEWIVNREYCGKLLTLNPGFRCSRHYHLNKHETFYVVDGQVWVELEGQTMYLVKGESLQVAPRQVHTFRAIGGIAHMMEFSTHHEDDDSYRLDQACAV